jgi:outer membrane protein assembly factor BamB
VYFGSNDGNFYAVWASNGTEKWRYNAGSSFADLPSSPTVVNGKVYFTAMNEGMYCLWASNGTKVWNRTIATPNWRNYNSPLVVNGSVYIANDLNAPATIYSLDADNGAIIWQETYSTYIISSAAYKDGKIYIGKQSGGGVICLWANNGTEFWNRNYSGGGVFSTPALSDDRVFFTTESGYLYALWQSDGSEDWSLDTGPTTYSSPVFSGDKVLIAGHAYYQSNGTEVWSNGYSLYSTPAVSGDRMVYLNETDLRCQSTIDGTVIWEADVDGDYGSPAIVDNMVIVGGDDGILRAFSSPDSTPPNVTSTDPIAWATDVDKDTNITISFSELMDETTAENGFSMFPSVTGQFTWNGVEMTFHPDSSLAYNTLHSVYIDGTARDRYGNSLDGNNNGVSQGSPIDDYTFSFTTEEAIPPVITEVYPADQQTSVHPNDVITVNFSDPMIEVSAQAAFSIDPPTTGVFSWDVNSTDLRFVPSSPMQQETWHNCTVSHSALAASGKLLDGNGDGTASGDATDDYTWSFYVSDLIPPQISEYIPTDGDSNIPLDSVVTVTFNEPMNASLTEAAFQIDPYVSGTFSWDAETMTFALTDYFDAWTTYTVTIGTGAADVIGNYLDGDQDGIGGESVEDMVSWSFTTGDYLDNPPPQISYTNPYSGQWDVPIDTDITIQFTKPMNQTLTEDAIYIDSLGSDYFWCEWNFYGDTVTVHPDYNLTELYTHTIYIYGDAESADGVPFDGNYNDIPEGMGTDDYSWSFTTARGPILDDPPYVVRVYPAADATDVPLSDSIVIEFSERMNDWRTENAISISPYVSARENWDSYYKNLTLDPYSDLYYSTTYTITIWASAESEVGLGLDGDHDGVAEGSGIDDFVWSFTTEDPPPVPQPPVILITEPLTDTKVKGTIAIKGTVTDTDTPLDTIIIEIMFDQNGIWIPVGTGGNWTYQWNTLLVKEGHHDIMVRAYDGIHYSQTHEITVRVDNEPGKIGVQSFEMGLLLILIVVIIIIVIIAALAFMVLKPGAPPGGQQYTGQPGADYHQQQPPTTQPPPQQPPPQQEPAPAPGPGDQPPPQ